MSIQPVGSGAMQYTTPAKPLTAVDGSRQADATPSSGETSAAKSITEADKATQLSPDQLAQAVNQIQDVIKQTAQSLQFSIDKDTGTTVVKVVDTESKKVLRQIPSEEVLAIAKALDKLQGLLVKQKV
ncbi:MAG: flagellar protein FlaG [Proteobacteria bacterium]|nr:flagellar protein FlaG [Pseudomonadota bacterium]RTL29042.1 MAG: flagellar protein FlaG [Rhodocyclaceae bacterium]